MPPKALIEIHPGKFSLNVSGVAGFFGGDEAISAIQTIHHYKYRKWMGWYNSPGSWNVGKKFGKIAKSRLWDGLFPGPDEEPAKCFELDGKQGPKYVASESGSVLESTGHLAYLIMQISKEERGHQVKGKRITKQNKVTIIKTQRIFKEKEPDRTQTQTQTPPNDQLDQVQTQPPFNEQPDQAQLNEQPNQTQAPSNEQPNQTQPLHNEQSDKTQMLPNEQPSQTQAPSDEQPNQIQPLPNKQPDQAQTQSPLNEQPNQTQPLSNDQLDQAQPLPLHNEKPDQAPLSEQPNQIQPLPNKQPDQAQTQPPLNEQPDQTKPPLNEWQDQTQMQPPPNDQPNQTLPNEKPAHMIPPRSGRHALLAIIPMAVSITACVLCACMLDWFCFSMILLGIVSNGTFSVVIGSARLMLQGVNSASTAPPGNGMLMDGDNIVLLFGKEEDIATITRGKFVLEYSSLIRWKSRSEKSKPSAPGHGIESDRNNDAENGQNVQTATPQVQVAAPQTQVAAPQTQVAGRQTQPATPTKPVRDEYNAIGLCSFLLVIQLLLQLLFIPQGKFGGQIMFLISFAFSWAYNLYLSSIDNEYIQQKVILRELRLEEKHIQTFAFGTRTTAAVFACLMLQPSGVFAESEWKRLGFEPKDIIHNFMSNNTPVWIAWKEKVLEVMRKRDGSRDTCHDLLKMNSSDEETFGPADRELLRQLLEDARVAYDQAMNEQDWLNE